MIDPGVATIERTEGWDPELTQETAQQIDVDGLRECDCSRRQAAGLSTITESDQMENEPSTCIKNLQTFKLQAPFVAAVGIDKNIFDSGPEW